MWTTAANSQQLPVSSDAIQNTKYKIQNISPDSTTVTIQNPKSKIQNQKDLLVTDKRSLITDLPCLDSSPECIDLLTEKAIAHSGELQTLEARIGLMDTRLGIATDSINYAESKLWTNYVMITL